MAWVYMDVAPTQEGGEKSYAFEKTISLTGAGDTDSILIPDDIDTVTVSVQAGSGATATVYTTTDNVSIVKAGTSVTWVESSLSGVTTPQAGTFYPVTAIKMTQTNAGTSKISVRAQ